MQNDMSEKEIIRLEIAKAAISRSLSQNEADRWVSWVLSGDETADGLPMVPTLLSDKELIRLIMYSDEYGERSTARISFDNASQVVTGLKYAGELSLSQAAAIAMLFGVKKAVDVIRQAVASGVILGTSDEALGYVIDKRSFLCWARCQGPVIIGDHSVCRMFDEAFRDAGILISCDRSS